jgi:short subunit dehydrogenase-like uncharacterized protein
MELLKGEVFMSLPFLLYGSNGFVGNVIAEYALHNNLELILAGRDKEAVKAQADKLKIPYKVFDLTDTRAIDAVLEQAPVVLNCAGPYVHTFKPILDGCLRTGTHYLDISGEVPVYEAIAVHDRQAKERGVMLMPGVGFDILVTDCLAVHLKNRLPSATHLALAYHMDGPAGLPPGTFKTMVEMVPYGVRVRKEGRIQEVPSRTERMIDFGKGPEKSLLLTWGDIFMAYHSTGITNIENYAAFPEATMKQISAIDRLRPLFKSSFIRNMLKKGAPVGPTPKQRSHTCTHVWGQVVDDQGNKATARLHGPEAAVTWTTQSALAVVGKVLDGSFEPGFMTPALVYGPDFVLEFSEVTREDLD